MFQANWHTLNNPLGASKYITGSKRFLRSSIVWRQCVFQPYHLLQQRPVGLLSPELQSSRMITLDAKFTAKPTFKQLAVWYKQLTWRHEPVCATPSHPIMRVRSVEMRLSTLTGQPLIKQDVELWTSPIPFNECYFTQTSCLTCFFLTFIVVWNSSGDIRTQNKLQNKITRSFTKIKSNRNW